MTWGTLLVLTVLLVIVFLAARSMVRDKRAGKHTCGGNCGACGGGCGCHNHMSDEEILEMAKRAAAEGKG